jgi:hypothetical protein
VAILTETIVGPSQVDLAAGTLTDVYTVGAGKMAVISTIVVCNRNGSPILYRLSIALAGAADNVKQYIAYDVTLQANTSDSWTIGVTLAATDVVRARSDTANVSVNVFKAEMT